MQYSSVAVNRQIFKDAYLLHRTGASIQMSLMFPLSGKQKTIWSLRWKGNSPSEIASELGTSRQYVHQVLLAAESKVSRTLLEVAQGANLQIKKVDPRNGVLLAYDPILKSNS